MPSNVTFIVGNGLDISLKLETSYRNFYEYVKRNSLHPDNSIYKAIEKEDPEYWADFELGLGRFTNKIETITEKERAQWSLTLNDELDEIKKDLKNYIKEQNDRADDHIPSIYFDKHSYYKGLETGQIANIRKQVETGGNPHMRFVTLNYTSVLEKIFPVTGRLITGKDYYISSPIHHVHGSIDRRISLGVNDESQLSTYIDTEEKKYLIKPQLIRSMNDGRLETLSSYITTSAVIVLFGVSLGATDRYIWEMVIDWMYSDPNRLLIIHHYEHGLDVDDLTERESLQLSDRVKNKFLSYSDLGDDDMDYLRLKMYTIPNSSNLFTAR